MSDDMLERVVRSAVRGVVEAVLHYEPTKPEAPSFEPPPPRFHEVAFPSVSKAQDEMFGEGMPRDNSDLDEALAALQTDRRIQDEAMAREPMQTGPGEREAAEWLRMPQ